MLDMIDDMARMKMDQTFGGRLRIARKEAGLDQGQLADRLVEKYGVKIGRSYISELERRWEDNKMPSAEVLAAMALALNVNGNWLLLIDDVQEPPGIDDDRAWSPTTNLVTKIMDGLPEPKRLEIMDVVQAMAKHAGDKAAAADLTMTEGAEKFADLILGNDTQESKRRVRR